MTNEAPTPQPDSTELAKQVGRAALKGCLNICTGKAETPVLGWIATGFRLCGVVILVMAVFKLGYFAPLAESIGWFRTVLYGLVSGLLTYGTGDVIKLLLNMELHLRKMAGK
jgi:hypothetical protein